MRLLSLCIRGFRSLEHVEITLEEITLLIGGNDAGKSTVLDALEIALTNERPDKDDFYCPPDGIPAPQIEITLEFNVEDIANEEVQEYAVDGRLKVLHRYSLNQEEKFFWGERVENENLIVPNFRSLSAGEQKEIIEPLDASVIDSLSNSELRTEWFNAYVEAAPKISDWIEIPRNWGVELPRFERYSTMDYSDPSIMITKTLQQVYAGVVFEEIQEGQAAERQYVPQLQQVKSQVQERVQEKVEELLKYMQRYNDKVLNISFETNVDFSGALKSGSFQINDGRGLHYLDKTGDGTKRRMFMATLDWDHDITLEQLGLGQLSPTIRGYDEPDTNLDYEAQKTLYRSILDLVNAQNSNIQAILCSHSPRLIDRAPAKSIRLLRLNNGCSEVEKLETEADPEIEDFLQILAADLGLTNSLMFYERCFILIEGPTEENALPILYRTLYGNSMLEDGIRIIPVHGNGAVREILRLFRNNRQSMTLVFVDRDTENNRETKLTPQALREAGYTDEFIDEHVHYVGQFEFEDAFSDEDICRCLRINWPKRPDLGEWELQEISDFRQETLDEGNKFSSAIKSLVFGNTPEEGERFSKPIFGKELAKVCERDDIPPEIVNMFELARQIANGE